LRLNTESLQIQGVRPGGPCHGLFKKRDTLVKIDGITLMGKSSKELVRLTQGVEGSRAELTVLCGLDGTEKTKTICRELTEDITEAAKRRIKIGLRRRDDEKIKEVFEKYSDTDHKYLCKGNLLSALKKFDPDYDVSDVDLQNVDDLIAELDKNGGKQIDLNEFTHAVKFRTHFRQDSGASNEWVDVVKVFQMLNDALPREAGSKDVMHPSKWTEDHIEATTSAFKHWLKQVLSNISYDAKALDNQRARQPATLRKLKCGRADAFHGGISSRAGYPNLDFFEGMRREHCSGECAKTPFLTTNSKIKTTPDAEWRFVTTDDPIDAECMRPGRRRVTVDDLMKVPLRKEAGLTEAEVIALNLYTGPMYRVYNSILRRMPEAVYDQFKANQFSTTIHVLASAVQKVSRVTPLKSGTQLYRGLGFDSELPDEFFKADRYGCSGFTEMAFMSTTLRKEVALERYSKVNDGNPSPKLLVFRTTSVDRGASIKAFSQYPDEDEFLFVPCSFIEKTLQPYMEKSKSGRLVPAYHVIVNVNLKALTLDQLQEEKKGFHTAAFNHLIWDIETDLKDAARQVDPKVRLEQENKQEQRLLSFLKKDRAALTQQARLDTPTDSKHTIDGFVSVIVRSCREVLNQHMTRSPKDYVNHETFRQMVLEMLQVRTMSRSKFDEWAQNCENSSLRLRWGNSLRTAHRQYLSFLVGELKRLTGLQTERREIALKICKLRGLVSTSVDERNEHGETPLMTAAADGHSQHVLRYLILAGSDVNAARDNGQTAIWLAAQFGHEECIKELVKHKANVNARNCDGQTPVFISAQSGHLHCLEVLVKLKADPLVLDMDGQSPLDLAKGNGRQDCVKYLDPIFLEAGDHVKASSGKAGEKPVAKAKHEPGSSRLIITSGDISDIDGFFALAAYARTGADVLFVMSYPAYIGVTGSDPEYVSGNLGLGFKYSAKEVLSRDKEQETEDGKASSYGAFLQRYDRSDDNRLMKCALTDVAFALASQMWAELGAAGKLVFCIGKENTINPFAGKVIKNEVLVYSELPTFKDPKSLMKFDPAHGTFYDVGGAVLDVRLEEYSDIVIDFCGSMSFWDEAWDRRMRAEAVASRVKAAFVMGGVLTGKEPVTLPPIEGVLNRFSSATMNQLYSPAASVRFFSFLLHFGVSTYVVTNNVVGVLKADDREESVQDTVFKFLTNNDIHCDLLERSSCLYYDSKYRPPRKPFDFYAALALKEYLRDPSTLERPDYRATLFFGSLYGTTFVSDKESWAEARDQYLDIVSRMDERAEVALSRAKETEEVKKMAGETGLGVRSLHFALDKETWGLSLAEPEVVADTAAAFAPQEATVGDTGCVSHNPTEAELGGFVQQPVVDAMAPETDEGCGGAAVDSIKATAAYVHGGGGGDSQSGAQPLVQSTKAVMP